MTSLRDLPSVDSLLNTRDGMKLVENYGHPLVLDAIRQTLDGVREQFAAKQEIPDQDQILDTITKRLRLWVAPTLQPVINASGVVIHTNLGRSPLSKATIQAMHAAALSYSNLEYDLRKGQRGSRSVHAEQLVQQLTGAEAALVVNNNASAVMLVLSALARRRRVVISRTQLIEIGGSFRIPDVMRQSGAILVEVGATNRVHLRDYARVIEEQPIVMILTAHWSNFKIIGFTGEPTTAELVALARDHNIPLVNDLGSGTFLDTRKYGLGHEPTVPEVLSAGVDIVTFSGDKLLGGPQAGIIAGRENLLAKIKKHPLARAVRADKLCLAGISATLTHYLKDEAESEIPIWRMIRTVPEVIRTRAEGWRDTLLSCSRESLEGTLSVIQGESTVGGGSLPGETLPTYLLAVNVPSTKMLLAKLRAGSPPVIARVQDDQVLLDPRTVLPEQDEQLLPALGIALER